MSYVADMIWNKTVTLMLSSALIISGCSITPKAIDNQTQLKNTQGRLDKIWTKQTKLSEKLSLSEAIARALKYNLEYRLQQAELMLQNGNLTMAYLQMLPALNVEGSYTFRNNDQIQNLVSSSGGLIDGTQSTTPREVRDVFVGLQWNILDFGLSYTRAQQQANRVMIAKEQSRKITQKIIQETITAYWKAWTAQEIKDKVINVKTLAEKALAASKEASDQKLSSNEIELNYQNLLIKSVRKANKLLMKISDAYYHLSRLINAPMGTRMILSSPVENFSSLPELKPEFKKLDRIALIYRPELRSASYELNIAKKGIQSAILEMLPGLDFSYGYNYTSNKFMLNQEWMGGAINASVDLLGAIIKGPTAIAVAKNGVTYQKLKQATITITVLTQIRIAYTSYVLWQEEYRYAKEEASATQKLYALSQAQAKHKLSHQQKIVRRGVDALNAEFNEQVTFIEAYEALSKLYQSIGLDLLPPESSFLSLEALTVEVNKTLKAQSTGDFNQWVEEEYQNISPVEKQ
ncbi:TolC family protein [Fangia hongkongensis]|uniref:TolC family protein n=1 Tax=Fangia hongkongensis TaxID=270495 RepID=UPI0003826014|nr:TolC family protein [Fangia hongkongensis]MBK2124810.1 TolC family protein [Fangia hongkongensis]